VPGFSTGPPLVFTGYFAASNSARISSVGAGVAGQHHAHHADADDGQAGCEEALLLAQLEVAELLQNVLRYAGRRGQHLAVRRGHRSRQDACKDEPGEAMPVR